ncbi:retrovirus-related pol polyprotein from transposon TNT 1-94 [Tanacetum coccineum]
MNSSMDNVSVNVHECEKCLKLETELLNKKDFVEKEIYDKLFKSFTTLEKHCISLETYKQLYDSIKLARIRSKEQCEDLINQVNLKSVEISELKANLQVKVLVITALKDDLRKHKGKALVHNDVTKHPSDPEMLKIDVEPITPKLLNKKTAYSTYIKHTQEEATILRDLVEQVKSKYPLNHSLEYACRYAKLIQELLTNISITCPSINNIDGKLVAVTPKNKDKRVRFTEPITSSGNTITKTASTSNIVSDKPMLSSTRVKLSTSASGSQPSGNTKKDKILQTPSSTQKNNVEAHPRKVKSSLKNKACAVKPKGTSHMQHSKLNANFELKCVKCNGCMLSDNHDLCVLDFINNVNARNKSTSVKQSSKRKVWKLTGKVLKSVSTNKKEPDQSWGSIVSNVPSSSLDDCKSSKSFSDMMTSSPIRLLSKASKTKSWLCHRCLSHLNFGAINHLARHGLVRGLLKLKFEKDHLCSACAMGLYGPMHVYILIIVDDYIRFTWVKCLRSKDEAPDFIIKFLKMIQVRLKVSVRQIRTDNGAEFFNQIMVSLEDVIVR